MLSARSTLLPFFVVRPFVFFYPWRALLFAIHYACSGWRHFTGRRRLRPWIDDKRHEFVFTQDAPTCTSLTSKTRSGILSPAFLAMLIESYWIEVTHSDKCLPEPSLTAVAPPDGDRLGVELAAVPSSVLLSPFFWAILLRISLTSFWSVSMLA